MITYSIIIPHKNTPHLLQRCLDSIPVRWDVQVIVVDDDSDPAKVDFSVFPGLSRDYTEVYFTKEGRGAGYARNIGLEKAKGKWIMFADSDDFFTPDFSGLTDKYRDSTCDIICFSTLSVHSDDVDIKADRDYNNKRIEGYLNDPGPDTEFQLRYCFVEPWAKMIRASLIFENDIRFQETMVLNDNWFSVNVGHLAAEICAERGAVYTVTYRENSLSSQRQSFRVVKTKMLVFNSIYWFFKKNGIPVERGNFCSAMRRLLINKPVWFFRISVELLKKDRKNIYSIATAIRPIPGKIKGRLIALGR